MALITANYRRNCYRRPKLDLGGLPTPSRENFLKNFPQRLKELGVTDSELARRVGVAPVSVKRWKEGDSEPNFNTLDKIAKALDTSVIALLSSPEELKSLKGERAKKLREALQNAHKIIGEFVETDD